MIVLFGLLSDKDYLRSAPTAPSDSPVSSHLHKDPGLGPTGRGTYNRPAHTQPTLGGSHTSPEAESHRRAKRTVFVFICSIKSTSILELLS